MKKAITTILLWAGIIMPALSQLNIYGKIENLNSDSLFVLMPFNGKFVPFHDVIIPVNKEGVFELSLPDTTPGIVKIFFGRGNMISIFSEPGEPDTVFVDARSTTNEISFRGANRYQNEFLNSLRREEEFTGFGNTTTEIELKYDTLPEIIYNNVLIMEEDEMLKLKLASIEHGFSKVFMEAVQADIHYYHVCLFTGICISEFAPYSRGKSSRFNENWGHYWDLMLHTQDISNEKSQAVFWYYRFVYGYISTFRGWFRAENIIAQPNWEEGEHLVNYDTLIRKFFKGSAKEYALASILMDEIAQKHFQYRLLEYFNNFKSEYPQSIYLPKLEADMKPVFSFFEKQNNDLTVDVKFIENGDSVNSLKMLYGLFPGRVIFVDIWATWCGPCKREFAYKKDIEPFMKENGIVPIFISIDDFEREQKWKEMVKYYNLKGYNIRANKTLLEELYTYFGQDGGLSIPRYAIIEKDGISCEPNAKRPSQKAALIKQLEKCLKN